MPTEIPDSPTSLSPETSALFETIRLTALGVSATKTENIFRDLVKHLAAALGVDHAFIGILEPGDRDEVRVIAGYFFNEFHDGFNYDLAGTPCQNVIGQQYRYYPENVQSQFPDPHLKELDSEGYAGIPLFGTRGNVLGVMAVMHRQPLPNKELTKSLLQIFSVRAAIELERRKAVKASSLKEDELAKSEHRMRTIVESSIDSIMTLDRDGHILEFNSAAEQCFGYKKSEVLDQLVAPLIVPQRYRQNFDQGMAEFRNTGSGAFLGNRVEIILMRSDGSEFPVEVAIDVAPGEDGEILIGYIRDISERSEAENQRRQLETQLQQAQKMEAIGQLTGGIAHDFNNILTAMMGYMTLAEEHTGKQADDKLSRYIERALRSGKRARDLIQQMLTFSRGQHGEPQPVSLALLINEWIGLLESTLPSSVEIKTELETDVPVTMIDPVQIEQVLTNLCINARDAMQGSGVLTVRLSHDTYENVVCASCRQPVSGPFIEISVADTGSGIPLDIQERIFEPFYSTKEVGHGSGMGLSMVHGIVHKHGGHLLLDSMPNSGSSLRILLKPIEATAATKDVAKAVEIQQTRQLVGRVMLVDDEPAVSEFMQDLLENWGLTVSVFNSSVDACRKFSDDIDQFDLVILDQTMPKMTGLEVSKNLLGLRPDLPIILYTGYNAEITEAQVSDQGIRALVKKPVDTVKLHDLVKDLLATG